MKNTAIGFIHSDNFSKRFFGDANEISVNQYIGFQYGASKDLYSRDYVIGKVKKLAARGAECITFFGWAFPTYERIIRVYHCKQLSYALPQTFNEQLDKWFDHFVMHNPDICYYETTANESRELSIRIDSRTLTVSYDGSDQFIFRDSTVITKPVNASAMNVDTMKIKIDDASSPFWRIC